ncbi:glycosyltransferase family 4 protein [Octadecabacter sp.]|nr:glycosyltransferase family 4 protein [Octadecabacter sp.]
MKVLQINNFHYPRGGSDRYFLNLMHALANNGHQVQSFAQQHKDDTDLQFRGLYYPSGLNLSRWSLNQGLNFFYNSRNRKSIRAILEHFQPDVAHLHIYYGHVTPSILKPLREMGVPIVQTLHEYKIVCPAQTLIKNGVSCDACKNGRYINSVIGRCNRNSFIRSSISALEAITSNYFGGLSSVDHFLAVSHFQRNKLLSMGLEPSKVDVLYNFADIKHQPSHHDGNHFLFVGRLENGKGLETLLDSYALYLEKCRQKGLPLHIVGDGSENLAFKRLAAKLGLGENVKWLGYLNGPELAEQYRKCRALINPSEFNETFGLTNLEAMTHGRPVLCSNSGAFPEVVRDGLDGHVLPCKTPEAFAEKMSKLTVDKARQLGMNGFTRASDKFSAQVHVKELEKVYLNLIGEK